nr:type VI secretion protein IcmF/TssM N-terminal domain-containing protein [uncultured Desulfobulbus sp.]
MLKKFLKFFLIILLLAAVAALLFWATLRWQLPWWVGPSLCAGCLGLWVAFRVGKRLFIRYRQKGLVAHVVASTPEPMAELGDGQNREQSLRNHWAKALSDLKNSTLRAIGSPTRVMPWFLILGESRDGKTSAIKQSHTSSPLTDIEASAEKQGTRNCDWWFCDQAVVLDTAGRYSIPLNESQDRREWEVFLELLLKTRKKKALQGVIVAVAANRLLTEDGASLTRKGQMIRQRLNQLMRLTGFRLPVYLLVTKMDLVHGFSDFFQCLSDVQAEETMGTTNDSPDRPYQDILNNAFDQLGTRLHDLRQILVHEIDMGQYPGAVLFPYEFQLLRNPLAQFCQGLFAFDRYLETPFLRGFYFSSSQQKGLPQSPFLSLIDGVIPTSVSAALPQASHD